jgi:hypothetical protein
MRSWNVIMLLSFRCLVVGWSVLLLTPALQAQQAAPVVKSVRSGAWSEAATWEGGKVPAAGCKVYVATGHTVRYDVNSKQVIRSLHLDGTLYFAPDRDTLLEVGLIRVNAGGTTEEEGFDCDAHAGAASPAALLVGTAEQPIDAKHTAIIRLHYLEGMSKESCPAIVCCGGRMDFHGAPLSRTWVKLGAPAPTGATEVTLAQPVTGWRAGDRIILTATTRQNKQKKTFQPSTRDAAQTEERLIQKIDGANITLNEALKYAHVAAGDYRGDVANLSRNVVVESADLKMRGHTMYHRNSSGSIAYAEFRHLGKEGVLGRYSLHYHLCGDTMRGSSVIGASIWDSDNRWLTIHGTNYLVVRDNVGYRSKGHGFFMEDGTEVYNVLDRNLAVQAYIAKPLPKQMLPFDRNDGSGFWWANCLNTFTRNVAAECDEYGYFFQATKTKDFNPELLIRQPDGTRKQVDIRTLPFVRFEENETHCQRRHGFNLGGGVPFGPPNVDGVGPDQKHPFVIRNLRAWNVHWAIHPVSPSVLLENLDVNEAEYGVWRPVYKDHYYRNVKMTNVPPGLHYAFVAGNKAPNQDADYPGKLTAVDDLPPITVITHVDTSRPGQVTVRGTTSDNGTVKKVMVIGVAARATASNFAEWEVVVNDLPAGIVTLTAHAEDAAGNVEQTKHSVKVRVR